MEGVGWEKGQVKIVGLPRCNRGQVKYLQEQHQLSNSNKSSLGEPVSVRNPPLLIHLNYDLGIFGNKCVAILYGTCFCPKPGPTRNLLLLEICFFCQIICIFARNVIIFSDVCYYQLFLLEICLYLFLLGTYACWNLFLL